MQVCQPLQCKCLECARSDARKLARRGGRAHQCFVPTAGELKPKFTAESESFKSAAPARAAAKRIRRRRSPSLTTPASHDPWAGKRQVAEPFTFYLQAQVQSGEQAKTSDALATEEDGS